MKTRFTSFYATLALLATAMLFSVASNADATGLDMTGITGAVDVTTVLAAITALAAIKVGPSFAKWAYNKVIGWFR